MAFKIDAGKSFAPKINKPKPPEATPIKPQTFSPNDNGAVLNKRASNNFHANTLKSQVTAQFFQQPPINTTTTNSPPSITPTLTQQEAQERADQIISDNGGRGNLDTDEVGKEIADIARQNPADAWLVTQEMLGSEIDQDGNGKVRENDKDEISQSFIDNLTDVELTEIGQSREGKELLERAKTHLLTGSVHSDEREAAQRAQNGIQGYPTPELVGNAEKDIETVANDLRDLPPEKRVEYLNEVLQHPVGQETLQRAALLSADDQQILADTLNDAYEQNPSEIRNYLNNIIEADKAFPIPEWSGFASVIAQTGNDDLIADYARQAMNVASQNPDNEALSVDVTTALAGMSPEGLNNFINFRSANPPQSGSPTAIGQAMQINQEAFNTMLKDAVDWLDGDANSGGFANPWAFNPALGNLLDVASNMTNADGLLNNNAIEIFRTVATSTGDNLFTKEAAGQFFVEHGQQLVDTFALKRLPNGTANPYFFDDENPGPEVLKDFFAENIYHPISDLLQTENGDSLVDAIMGENGTLASITETLADRAAVEGADVTYIGEEIGYLYGAVSGGFLDAVDAYKDQFKEDKEFREFTYGLVDKALGAIAKKVGVPVDKAFGIVKKLIEAGKASERSEQLRGYQEAFLDLKNEVSESLINFQNDNPNAEGLETSFTRAWNDFITSYLAQDWIAS